MLILINILLVIEVLSALLIILLVLMQRPKNEGLGAAFGGGMTENLFGAQTTNVLQTFTRNLGIFFFALTALISWLYVRQGVVKSDIQKQLATAPAVPAAMPAPGATPAPARSTESRQIPHFQLRFQKRAPRIRLIQMQPPRRCRHRRFRPDSGCKPCPRG
jgi:preprotein translocase subunit SecG